MQKKRGQISVFFILGVMLLILVMFYYISSEIMNPDTSTFHKKNIATKFDRESLQEFVDYCVVNQTQDILIEIGKNGGTLNQTDIIQHSKLYKGENYRLLCVYVEGSQYCVNRILTLKDMEGEIAEELLTRLDSCLDFNYFEELGYEIELGEKTLDVGIGINEVTFDLRYPISLKKQNIEVKLNDYFTSFKHPLGLMYKSMIDILNHETTYGTFNKDEWMYDNNMLFNIEKNKPYPYITYSIIDNNIISENAKEYVFRFSLELKDKASNVVNYVSETNYGCCYLAQECIKSTDELTCKNKGGSYEHSNRCSCDDTIYTVEIEGFNDCGQYMHGESWCQINEGVGARDIKLSCLDGNIVEEACKDFHEEVCVEYTDDNKDKAICKINRYEDCVSCSLKECCENNLLRDCQWYEKTYEINDESNNRQCLPKVSPGFRFWDGAGQEICNLGTKWAQCDGWSCGNDWVQYSSTYCSELGDCGINRNYNGKVSKSGYFETDPKYNPSFTNLDRGFLTINSKQEDLLFTQTITTFEMIPTMISAVLNYLDDAVHKNKEILDYSFCGLYEAPLGGKCDMCGEDCTEYKCHSLGQDCFYEEENGFPKCVKKEERLGEVNIEVTSEQYQGKTLILDDKTLVGYVHIEKVNPFELVEFNITTDVPTKCKITYLPEFNFVESPAIWLGKPKYSTTHNISFRLPESIQVPKQIYNTLNVSSLDELYDLFVENNETLKDYFDEDFMNILEEANEFISDKDFMKDILNLTISGIDDNIYYTFFRCSDESGNYNKDPLYLRYEIDDATPDLKSPQIVYSIPFNGSYIAETPYNLTIYLDEPSECKYSEEDEGYGVMPYEFECETSQLRPSLYGGGSYECKAETSIIDVHVRCRDKPVKLTKYQFKISNGTQDNYEILESNIDNGELLIEVGTIRNVTFLLDYYDSCRIGFNGFDYGVMSDLICEIDEFGINMNCTHSFAGNDYDAYMVCIAGIYQERNINPESQRLRFFQDDDLSIVSYFPEYDLIIDDSVSVGLVINKDILKHGVNCGYGFNDDEFYQLYPVGNYQFRRNLYGIDTGDYNVEFRCSDNSGNIAYDNTRFIAR